MSVPISQGREAGRCIEKTTTRYRAWNRCVQPYSHFWRAQAVFPVRQTPSELLPFFVRALGGILSLDALAIVRMEGKKGVCETACWSGTPHLPEALMLRAFNGKRVPQGV